MSDERPNIVLVTVDSLRADHCGFMGYEKDTTPTLDRMAEKGVVFENATAPAPFTEQSMPAIFSGHDILPSDVNQYCHHVNRRPFLPDLLSQKGYRTAGFTPNPFTSSNFGFDRSFDEFHDFFENDSKSEIAEAMASRIINTDFVEAIRLGANMAGYNIPGLGNQSIPLRSYYDMVLDWVEQGDEPFFLWLFLLEVHSPYRPTREYRTVWLPEMLHLNFVRSYLLDRDPTPQEAEKLEKIYDGTIEMADSLVEQLMIDLSSYDPTLIFHSDHGESFGEHDNFGHNDYLFEENIHVPLLITNTQESKRVSDPLSLRMLPEIICRIADGCSLTDDSVGSEYSISQVNHEQVSVRAQNRKYIFDSSGGRVYNLGIDQLEQKPRASNPSKELTRVASYLNTLLEKEAIGQAVSEVDSV